MRRFITITKTLLHNINTNIFFSELFLNRFLMLIDKQLKLIEYILILSNYIYLINE